MPDNPSGLLIDARDFVPEVPFASLTEPPEFWPLRPGISRFEETLKFMRALRVPEGPLINQQLRLLPYQVEAVQAICDPVIRRVIISLPRKAGKTAFAAALCLAATAGPLARMNSQVYSSARSRDQAALVFNLAHKMAQITPWLHGEVLMSEYHKKITGRRTNVVYRALASRAQKVHGLSPVLVIHDELGQVVGPVDDLYDALETSFGAQVNPKSVIISTQAAGDADLLSVLIDDAIASNDPHTKVILYSADLEDDPWSEETWRRCHPAFNIFRDPADFHDAATRARRLPSAEVTFRRYYLNQRVTGDTGIVTPNVWAANNSPPTLSLFTDGRPVYGGLDLSARQDLTALALACEDDEQNVHLLVRAWTPEDTALARSQRDRAPYMDWIRDGHLLPVPGASINYSFVASDMAQLIEGMSLESIAFDRWRIEELKRELERIGLDLPLFACGQGYKDFSPRLDEFVSVLASNKLRHGSNPVLTYSVVNAVVTSDPAGNKKLDKARSHGRIDPLIASVMAIGQMRVASDEATITVLPIQLL